MAGNFETPPGDPEGWEAKRMKKGNVVVVCAIYVGIITLWCLFYQNIQRQRLLFSIPTPWEIIQWTFFSYLEKESCVENWIFRVGLAKWIEPSHLMLQVRGSNLAQFKNTTFLLQPQGTPRGAGWTARSPNWVKETGCNKRERKFKFKTNFSEVWT